MKAFCILPLVLAASSAMADVATPSVPVALPDGTTAQIKLDTLPSTTGLAGSASIVKAMSPNKFVVPNAASLMKPRVGFNTLRIRPVEHPGDPSTDYAQGDDSTGQAGSFRIDCKFSHMLFDDPIVYPYQPDMSHLHVFFGNSDVTGMSDTATLEDTGTRSTCAGGIANRSGYWVPAIIDMATGFAIQPTANEVYYKEALSYGQLNPGQNPSWKRSIQVFPAGLRMIAGNAGNTTGNTFDNPNPGKVYYAPKYACIGPDGTLYPQYGQIPPPNHCPVGGEMIVLVPFPQCWDGVNLDSPDHQSHMAYANDEVPNGHPDQGCPKTHPVPLPGLSFNVHYSVTAASPTTNWRLSSDNYSLDKPGGGSMHGDWIYGWSRPILTKIVENCIRKNVDCHTNLLGDHTTLY